MIDTTTSVKRFTPSSITMVSLEATTTHALGQKLTNPRILGGVKVVTIGNGNRKVQDPPPKVHQVAFPSSQSQSVAENEGDNIFDLAIFELEKVAKYVNTNFVLNGSLDDTVNLKGSQTGTTGKLQKLQWEEKELNGKPLSTRLGWRPGKIKETEAATNNAASEVQNTSSGPDSIQHSAPRRVPNKLQKNPPSLNKTNLSNLKGQKRLETDQPVPQKAFDRFKSQFSFSFNEVLTNLRWKHPNG